MGSFCLSFVLVHDECGYTVLVALVGIQDVAIRVEARRLVFWSAHLD